MQAVDQNARISRKVLWAGYVLSALPVLILSFSSALKLMRVPSVIQAFVQYGYPASLVPVIGILEICCAIVYVIPRTSILGAVLMTGLLGGAIESNVRTGSAMFSVPLILGLLAWGGLYLREPRLHLLIPLRNYNEHGLRQEIR